MILLPISESEKEKLGFMFAFGMENQETDGMFEDGSGD